MKMIAMTMLIVLTTMEVSHVHATMVILEMAHVVKILMNVH